MLKWVLSFFVATVGRLPFNVRGMLGENLGCLLGFFPTRNSKIAQLQMKKFLGTNNSLSLTRKLYKHFGRTFFECLNLHPLIQDPEKYIDFPSWSEAERLLAQKKGIVALTAHIGNWDAMGAFFANRQVPLLVIAKQLRNPNMHFVLEKLRASFGFRTLWRANKQGVTEIIRALNSGQVVAALIDQDTRVTSLPIPFFGEPASTPSTIIEIGKRSGALFATAFVVRNKNCRFEIQVQEIPSEWSTEQILTEYNRRLEVLIREYPEQWAWVHKRWRTLASGERLGGRAYLEHLTNTQRSAQS